MREVIARRWCEKCETHQIKKPYYRGWVSTVLIPRNRVMDENLIDVS